MQASFFPSSAPQCKYDGNLSFRCEAIWKCFTHDSRKYSFPPTNIPERKYDASLKRLVVSCTSLSPRPSTPHWKYDVFLSFRGADTRKHFTDHLYTALDRHGIITFRDDPELEKGKDISPELFAAIQESRFAMIVLSENYASSTWCLKELWKIFECMEKRNTVLPIFYGVDPSDVRKQTGSFSKAFTKHEENHKLDHKEVQSWRLALTKVANLSGWDSHNWSEAELVKDIVQVVWKKLRPTLFSHVDDLVGIDSKLKPMINLILDANKVDDVSFVGIWGMGGIGKTTIARVVFDTISHQFVYQIFLAGVRNISEKNGLPHLQKQLLCKIGMQKNETIEDIHEGATLIRRFLYGKKVLLILDDVNHLNQLEYLAGNHEWFGTGSLVLITTRNEQLLFKHDVDRRFEVEELNKDDSLQLFSWKAFKKDYPEPNFVDLSNRVVDYAKGLPLALKVLGSFLYGRGVSAWNSELDKLRKVSNSEVFETLEISYDGLDDDEKKIFLDIACFFNGEGKDRMRDIFDACGFYAHIGIEVLVEKSLLSIDSNTRTLSMHDLLQEMGREIVRRESPNDPGKRSRLWQIEDINHVLSENTGTETIEGMMILDQKEKGVVDVNSKSFSMMKKLRYLKLHYHVNLSEELEYLPNSLRILGWPKFPLKSLPLSFKPEVLVELDMHESRLLAHLWKGINKVGPSVVGLERLTLLNLEDCENLESLPSSARGLKSLKVLNVSGCLKLDKLPQNLGHAQCLEVLDVSRTNIRQAPSSIGGLKNLKKLSFGGCNRRLCPLQLPSFSGLHSLTDLNLSRCNLVEGDIPNDLGCLSSLQILDLSDNYELVRLPMSSICQLSQLVSLDVTNCYKLRKLPELPSSVYSLIAINCESLDTSGLDMVQFFANSIKEVEKKGRSVSADAEISAAAIMREILRKAPFPPRKIACQVIVPGNEIPKWLYHKVGAFPKGNKENDNNKRSDMVLERHWDLVGPQMQPRPGRVSVTVELERGWFSDKWIGFAFCAVMGQSSSHIFCIIYVNGRSCKFYLLSPFESEHLWLCYLSRNEFLGVVELEDKEWRNKSTKIVFSFRCLDVIKCGLRVLYKDDDHVE